MAAFQSVKFGWKLMGNHFDKVEKWLTLFCVILLFAKTFKTRVILKNYWLHCILVTIIILWSIYFPKKKPLNVTFIHFCIFKILFYLVIDMRFVDFSYTKLNKMHNMGATLQIESEFPIYPKYTISNVFNLVDKSLYRLCQLSESKSCTPLMPILDYIAQVQHLKNSWDLTKQEHWSPQRIKRYARVHETTVHQ